MPFDCVCSVSFVKNYYGHDYYFSAKNTIFLTSHLHWAKRSVIKSKSLLINIKNRIQANEGRMGYRGRGESRFCLAIMHIHIKAVYVVSNLDRFGKKKKKRKKKERFLSKKNCIYAKK